jgi:hypothetical protein
MLPPPHSKLQLARLANVSGSFAASQRPPKTEHWDTLEPFPQWIGTSFSALMDFALTVRLGPNPNQWCGRVDDL